MNIGPRLRTLRQEKKMLQRDIEERTGMLCCYISRVENGHTLPGLETLQKFAAALEVPLHMLFYEGEGEPEAPSFIKNISRKTTPKESPLERKLRTLMARMNERDRRLFLHTAQKMAAG